MSLAANMAGTESFGAQLVHTNPESDQDVKIDADGWQAVPPSIEWEKVERKRSRSPTPEPTPRPVPKQVWRKVQPKVADKTAALKELQAAERERVRVAAFRKSRDHPPPGLALKPISVAEPEVVVPSATRNEREIRISKSRHAAMKKRRTAQVQVPPPRTPVKEVTKAEAAAPVAPTPTVAVPVNNPFAPLAELSDETRGRGYVEVLKTGGSTHLENNAGRNMLVCMREYEIVAVDFTGFFKKTLSSDFLPQSVGWHASGDKFLVKLPRGLVEHIGAFLVGRIPNLETYLASQAYCRNLIRPIDFEEPEMVEDAMIYAPYLALINRAGEREAIMRKVTGNVFTHVAQRCIQAGLALGMLSAIPVASAAATVAVPSVVGLGAAAMTAIAVSTVAAYGVYKARQWFPPDERPQHVTLSSVNSTAKRPAQHPRSDIRRLTLVTKPPDAVRPNAARVTGIAFKGSAPTVFAKNQDNTVAALEKRSGVLPAPFERVDRLDHVKWMLKHWPDLVDKPHKILVPSEPDLWAEYANRWVDGCGSTPAAKSLYRATIAKLASLGITPHTELTHMQVYEWTKREATVKHETVLKGPEKSPRQILAASPEFVVLTAPFIKDLTGVVRKKWNANHHCVYTPGVSSKRIADAMTDRHWDNRAILDFDGYDSSQDADIADGEIKVCKLYHSPCAMNQLMYGNIRTHGASREGVKFTTPYVRNSGDPWTTLFNTVLNGSTSAYVFCKVRECHPLDLPHQFKDFAGGDDGTILYNGDKIDFSAEFAQLGLPATVLHVDNLEDIEFLSCRLTHTSTGWNLIPMVGKTVAKIAYSVRAESDHKAKQIARGAALSLYDSSSGCPPLRCVLEAILRVTSDVDAIMPRDEPWKLATMHTGHATHTTRAQLQRQYGWTDALQEILVARMAAVEKPGVIIDSPAIDVLIDRDTGRADHLYPRAPDRDDPVNDWARSRRDRNREQHATNGNHDAMLAVEIGHLHGPEVEHVMVHLRTAVTEHALDTSHIERVVVGNTILAIVYAPIWAIKNIVDGYTAALAARRNQEQHASNGNIRRSRRQPGRPTRPRRVRRVPRANTQRNLVVVASRRARRVNVGRVQRFGSGFSDVDKYMCCLNDPFNCAPVRLGAGCAVNTGIATLYFTSLQTLASNGVVSLVIWPRPLNPVQQSSSASTAYGYSNATTSMVYPQLASLQAIANAVRVVAAGVKITSTSSATTDSGLIVGGLLPRDNFEPVTFSTSSNAANTVTESGLPFQGLGTSSTVYSAPIGINEFLNLEQTESFALRKGIKLFFRPEDPVDLMFKNAYQLTPATNNAGTVTATEDMQPASPVFVAGITGGASAATFLIESILHVEYTVGPITTSVVNTGKGTMTSDTIMNAATRVFGGAINLAKEGISGGFNDGARGVVHGVANNILNRAANYFSSTDNQHAVVPQRNSRHVPMIMD